jgi:hypothetical protein
MNLLSMLKKGAFRPSSAPTVATVATVTVTVTSPWGRESALDASTVSHASPLELERVILPTVATVAKVKIPSIKPFETNFSQVNSTSCTGGECTPQGLATVTVATIATVGAEPPDFAVRPFGWAGSPLPKSKCSKSRTTSPKPELLAELQALDTHILEVEPADTQSANRYCWPHSIAMTGAEIDTFTARVARITDKGVPFAEAEPLAEKLLMRDRASDDRRMCLECSHLGGGEHSSWRCGSWRKSGIALRARDAELPKDLVKLLQRCPGFNAVLTGGSSP